jgi:hypothetical protein
MATCTPEKIARSVANYKRLRDERRARGLCLCTSPLAVRDGRQMGACEGCLEDRRAAKRLAPRKLANPTRPCGCGKFGRHRLDCVGSAT